MGEHASLGHQQNCQHKVWNSDVWVGSQWGPIAPPVLQTIVLLLNSRTGLDDPVYENTIYWSYRLQRKQVGTNMEVSFLLDSFHSSRGNNSCYWGRKAIKNLTQLWSLGFTTDLARHDYWCNSDKEVIEVTSCFLIVFKFHSTRWKTCLVPWTRTKQKQNKQTSRQKKTQTMWLTKLWSMEKRLLLFS